MATDFPVPVPSRIDIIASTDANTLLSCPLKFAFHQDPKFRAARRRTPATALGNAAHAVREAAYRCAQTPIEQRAARFLDLWEQSVQKEYSELLNDWAPQAPPEPGLWNRYQIVKISSLRAANRIAERVPYSATGVGEPKAGTGIEAWREAPGLRLRCKVDRIDRVNGRLRVIDVKSGSVGEELKPDYRRQLLLNAAVVQAVGGEWPLEIALEPVTGKANVLPLDPDEATDAVHEVSEAIDAYNATVGDGTILQAAQPSPDTCMFCPYRTMCGKYWNSVQPDWGHHSVLGEITAVMEHDGVLTVTLSNLRASDEESVTVQGLHPDHVPPEGWLACCDLEHIFGYNAWRAKWSSRVTTYTKPAVSN